ncbi:hypothetical protein GE09DRAFT_350341 [Coniochaeta sp. 2T2.1]|nr:hypothetical protein GE09DRAFT_350341 [Coniochaeta sp. 2T2.1]
MRAKANTWPSVRCEFQTFPHLLSVIARESTRSCPVSHTSELLQVCSGAFRYRRSDKMSIMLKPPSAVFIELYHADDDLHTAVSTGILRPSMCGWSMQIMIWQYVRPLPCAYLEKHKREVAMDFPHEKGGARCEPVARHKFPAFPHFFLRFPVSLRFSRSVSQALNRPFSINASHLCNTAHHGCNQDACGLGPRCQHPRPATRRLHAVSRHSRQPPSHRRF